MLFNFLWNNTTYIIKRSTIINKIEKGGLKMVDLDCYIKSIKARWINRMCNSQEEGSVWRFYGNSIMQKTGLDKIINFIVLECIHKIGKCVFIPEFYKECFVAYSCCNDMSINTPQTTEAFLDQCMWGNKNILFRGKILYFNEWVKADLVYLRDLPCINGVLNEISIYTKLNSKANFLAELYKVKNALNIYRHLLLDFNHTWNLTYKM
jgi:hypothetical protein